MARGHPDYFGVSTFIKYGDFTEHLRINNTIDDGVRDDVFNLEAKARVYGLYVHVTGFPAKFDGLDIITTIDGDELESVVVDTLFERQYGQAGGYHLKYSFYDPDAGVITLVGATDITFELGYQLEFDNDTGGTIFITGSIHYANIL